MHFISGLCGAQYVSDFPVWQVRDVPVFHRATDEMHAAVGKEKVKLAAKDAAAYKGILHLQTGLHCLFYLPTAAPVEGTT